MNLHFSCKAKRSAEAEQELHVQVGKLERRLQVYRPELVHLHGMIEAQPRTHRFAVVLNLRLPSGQLTSHAENPKANIAVKTAFGELISQLQKHKELLRHEHLWHRSSGHSMNVLHRIERLVEHNLTSKGMGYEIAPEHVEKPEPVNGEFRDITPSTFARGHKFVLQSDIRKYINAKLDRIEKLIAVELTQMEARGVLYPGQVTVAEVVDEVVLAALSAESKPQNHTMERWLYRLSLQSLKRLTQNASEEAGTMHLEQTMQNGHGIVRDEEWPQTYKQGESLHVEDVVPDVGMGSPEQMAASDEMMEQVENVLLTTSQRDREIFYMLSVEGFELDEIAHITQLPIEDIRRIILRARDLITHQLPQAHALKIHFLRYSNVA